MHHAPTAAGGAPSSELTAFQRLRASKNFTLAVLCIATFTDVLIYGLVVPVLPFALTARIGLPEKDVQRWNSILMGTYGISVSVGSILFGWIGDRTKSRRLPFMVGLVMLAISTVVFALAQSLAVLEAARIFQGLASSAAATVGVALLVDKVGQKHIGEALGWTSLFLTVGFFLGPIVGGFLYQYGGYFVVFVPAFVLVAVEIILRGLIIEDREHLDQESQSIKQEGNNVKSYGTLPSKDNGNHSPHMIPSFANTEATQYNQRLSSHDENHHGQYPQGRSPLLALLANPRMLVAMESLMVFNSFNGALESVLPWYCHEVFGLQPSRTALVFIPSAIPLVLSPWMGRFVDRQGPRFAAIMSYSLCIPIFILMGLATQNRLFDGISLILSLFLFGCMSTVAVPAMMSEVTRAIDDLGTREPGIFGPSGAFSLGFGLNHCTFSLGIFIGTAYGGFMRETFGWPAMAFTMAGLSLITSLLIIGVTGKEAKTTSACPNNV